MSDPEGGRRQPAEIHTQRLHLRSWRSEDLTPFAELNADPRVRRWFPGVDARADSDASVSRFVDHQAAHNYTLWAVEVVDSERGAATFVGACGLLRPGFDPPFSHADPLVEVGWRFHPDWWGMGLATEAASACLDYAFTAVNLPEVVSFTVPPNLASQAVMQRIGMRYDGVFEHPRAHGAWWGPHVLYRISRT